MVHGVRDRGLRATGSAGPEKGSTGAVQVDPAFAEVDGCCRKLTAAEAMPRPAGPAAGGGGGEWRRDSAGGLNFSHPATRTQPEHKVQPRPVRVEANGGRMPKRRRGRSSSRQD